MTNDLRTFKTFKTSRPMKRSAFTLVELLVVVAVIGILAGLMVPLVQGMHKRALASEAKDLCVQVADAWALLPIDYGRFPLKSLFPDEARRGFEQSPGQVYWEYKGDIAFAMSPGIGNLLNFWTPKSPLPLTDTKAYPQDLKKAKVNWSGSEPPDQAEVDKWKPDTRFERSTAQKRFGVFPMGSRSDDSDGDRVNDRPVDSTCLVVVMIDADGDGVVRPKKYWLPGETGAPAGDDEEDSEEIRRRAIAWCKVARADGQLVFSWK